MAVTMGMRMAVAMAVGGRGGVRFIVHPVFYQSGQAGKSQNVTLLQNKKYIIFYRLLVE
jgi:hypothetical protein